MCTPNFDDIHDCYPEQQYSCYTLLYFFMIYPVYTRVSLLDLSV